MSELDNHGNDRGKYHADGERRDGLQSTETGQPGDIFQLTQGRLRPGVDATRITCLQRSVGNAVASRLITQRLTGTSSPESISGDRRSQEHAESLRLQAISIIDAALDLASAGALEPESHPQEHQAAERANPSPFTAEQIAHLTVARAELEAIRGKPTEEIQIAAQPIIMAARSQTAESRPTAQSLQRAAVLAAPAIAAGPPGWVVLAVAAVVVGGVVVYQMARARPREQARAEPRVRPRTTEPPVHMGNIHVQGDDVDDPVPNFAWNQPIPMTKAAALAALMALQSALSRRQLTFRNVAFTRATNFINTTIHGAPPPLFRTFQNPNVIQDPNLSTRRVDIEIIRGQAFL